LGTGKYSGGYTMTNERIDLSLYDGITKGKWEVIDTPGGGIDVGVKHSHNSHSPVITFTQRLADMVRNSERDTADLQAIADIPILIAELKRCYSLIDDLQEESMLMLALEEVAEFADMFCTKCRIVDGMSDHICGEASK
jgi:hypothetical protein